MRPEEKEKAQMIWINGKHILEIVGFLILLAITEAYLKPLKDFILPESYFQDWGFGILGIILCSIALLIPSYRFLVRFKKFWTFMLCWSVCWLIIDWSDFIAAIGI